MVVPSGIDAPLSFAVWILELIDTIREAASYPHFSHLCLWDLQDFMNIMDCYKCLLFSNSFSFR